MRRSWEAIVAEIATNRSFRLLPTRNTGEISQQSCDSPLVELMEIARSDFSSANHTIRYPIHRKAFKQFNKRKIPRICQRVRSPNVDIIHVEWIGVGEVITSVVHI